MVNSYSSAKYVYTKTRYLEISTTDSIKQAAESTLSMSAEKLSVIKENAIKRSADTKRAEHSIIAFVLLQFGVYLIIYYLFIFL